MNRRDLLKAIAASPFLAAIGLAAKEAPEKSAPVRVVLPKSPHHIGIYGNPAVGEEISIDGQRFICTGRTVHADGRIEVDAQDLNSYSALSHKQLLKYNMLLRG